MSAPQSVSEAPRARSACRTRRVLLKYVPAFEGAIEGYVVNQLKSNFWRVQATMEREDVMQEARIVFLRCAQRYPDVTDAPHFMALFKSAWYRRFTDLTNLDTRHRETFVGTSEDEADEITSEAVGSTDNEGFLRCVLREAPREVRMVLSLVLNAPAELLEVATARADDRRCKNPSKTICRMLGLPEDRDVLRETADYIRA